MEGQITQGLLPTVGRKTSLFYVQPSAFVDEAGPFIHCIPFYIIFIIN